MKNKFYMMGLALTLIGCGHAWVVSQEASGGVIGYQGTIQSEDIPNSVRNLIPCTAFKLVSDLPMTSNYVSVATQNQIEKSGASLVSSISERQNYEKTPERKIFPQTEERIKSWRQLTYTCSSPSEAMAARNPSGSVQPGASQDESATHEFRILSHRALKY